MTIKNKESYIKKVFSHLMDNKGITPAYAFKHFGCLRLASVIHDLRKKGVPIETKIVKVGDKTYARYTLTRGFILKYKEQLEKAA